MTERKRKSNLRPVREVTTPSLEFRTIHGYKRAFRIAGSGPAILLIHGIGDSFGQLFGFERPTLLRGFYILRRATRIIDTSPFHSTD